MDAEKQRTASEKEHLARSAAFSSAEAKVKALEKKLSRLVLRFSLKGLVIVVIWTEYTVHSVLVYTRAVC